jgi:hypothetical protein
MDQLKHTGMTHTARLCGRGVANTSSYCRYSRNITLVPCLSTEANEALALATRLLEKTSVGRGNCGISYFERHVVCADEGPGRSISLVCYDTQLVPMMGLEKRKRLGKLH